jgi:hypothetical protein
VAETLAPGRKAQRVTEKRPRASTPGMFSMWAAARDWCERVGRNFKAWLRVVVNTIGVGGSGGGGGEA